MNPTNARTQTFSPVDAVLTGVGHVGGGDPFQHKPLDIGAFQAKHRASQQKRGPGVRRYTDEELGITDPLDAFAQECGAVDNPRQPNAALPRPSFRDLLEREINTGNILLGQRWICRGGAAMLVAPAGVGKSTLIQQMVAEWSCGRISFGIVPTKPLVILIVQAENDEDDLHEIAVGVYSGLKLSPAELLAVHSNTRFVRVFECGDDFLVTLEHEIRDFKPDLVVIDPLNAYIGGATTDPALIAAFCRNGLNPLMFKYSCGLILVHHTTKTCYRDTSKYSTLDFSYANAGDADLTNWARAILNIEPLSYEDGIFRLIASKRGKRIGWTDDEGSSVLEKAIRHSRERGVIRWEDASQDDVQSIRRRDGNGKPQPEPSDVLEYFEPGQLIGKEDLIHQVNKGLKIGVNKARSLIEVLLERGELHEHRVKRSRKRDARMIGTEPQIDEIPSQERGAC